MLRRLGLGFDGDDLAEDADDLAAGVERHGAELDLDPVTVRVDEDALHIGHLGAPNDLLREQLTRATGLFRRADGRVLPAAHIADKLASGWTDPADDPVLVDHVGRDVDWLKSAFDVGVERT